MVQRPRRVARPPSCDGLPSSSPRSHNESCFRAVALNEEIQMTATLSWLDEITMTELERNPYPVYERLRAEAPLAYVPVLGSFVATTADLCRTIANSPDFEGIITKAGGRTFGHPAVIGVNGEIHRDLRSMVDPALQPSEVDRWVDGLVRPIARRYVEQFENDGNADLVSQYCEPVSVRALGDLL